MRKPFTRIHGKRVTEPQLINEIHSLLHGTGSRPYPLSVTEVAKTLGVSRMTIYRYIRKMKKEKSISKLKDGHWLFPQNTEQGIFRQFNKQHPITTDPLVTDWMDDLLTRRNGAPLKSWRSRLVSLEIVCNTCKVNPQDFIVSKKKTERILKSYAKLYNQGKSVQSLRGQKPKGLRTTIKRRVQGVRDFCSFYDMFWPRGVSGIMSQKIIGHGKYGDVRLTPDDLKKADGFIKQRWGLDSDIYRWFWVGIESCARFSALYNMRLDYDEYTTQNNQPIYVMTAIESKTEQIRGGKWYKYITRPDTQKSLTLLKSRGGTKIYESNLLPYKFKQMISNSLKLIYKEIGKHLHYFEYHPTHALRHIGAHYWLSKTNYNYGLIAEIGGWNTMDELKKSYGQIPPEKILELLNTQ